MRNESQAKELIEHTISTIIKQPIPPGFKLELTDNDQLDTPCVLIQKIENTKVLVGMKFPQRQWERLNDDGLRAAVAIELVNYFFQDLTPLEIEMVEALAKNSQQLPDDQLAQQRIENANEIRREFEIDRQVNIIELARKLKGDNEVYTWLKQAGFAPKGAIEFFDLLTEETLERIKPASRIPARLHALEIRIQHIDHIINGRTNKARRIRVKYEHLTQAILQAHSTLKTPSTV